MERTISIGDVMTDPHGQQVTVAGFVKDYAGVTMVEMVRTANELDASDQANELLTYLDESVSIGDEIHHVYYPEDLS